MYDYFTPAFKAGGPIQSLHNLVDYLNQTFSFSVLTGAYDKGEINYLNGIRVNEWNSNDNGVKIFYLAPSVFKTGMLISLLRSKEYDAVYLNGLYSPYFNILPLIYSKNKIILAPRGMLHPGALSQKPFKKKAYLFFFKLFGWHKKVIFHATDETELGFIKKIFGDDVTVKSAPNIPHFIGAKENLAKEKGKLVLVSVALISPMKNIELVLQSLKQVAAKIDYHIYGPVKEEKYWATCLKVIKELPANISVNYYNEIEPALVPSVIEKAQAFILPSKSENFGHAIFESFSSAKPVITSNYTPWNNLEQLKAGWNVDISTTDELKKAIEQLADMEQPAYNEYCGGAFELAKNYMATSNFMQAYQQLFSLE